MFIQVTFDCDAHAPPICFTFFLCSLVSTVFFCFFFLFVFLAILSNSISFFCYKLFILSSLFFNILFNSDISLLLLLLIILFWAKSVSSYFRNLFILYSSDVVLSLLIASLLL